jgi:hypothetical protein
MSRRQTRPLGTGVSCTSLAILLFGDHVLLLHVDDAVTLGHFCLCSNKLIARTLIFVVVGYTLRLFCFSLLRFLYAGTNPQWSYVRDKNTVAESDGGYRHCGKCSSIPTCLCIVGTLAILLFSVFFSSFSRLIFGA